ncbi:MAG TPA: ATPase domain-containing protein [Thermoanaerobaculia bacterium]|nr:ATPase domain-containing protein [Thermoanaerobaculia bacterium]
MTASELDVFPRASTGIEGLDYILGGGFPRNRMYLVKGDPGAGKRTLAMQFLLAGVRAGEPGVYATLSESEEELRDVARSHGWSLDGITICDLQASEESLKADSQYTLFHPSEVELSDTTRTVLDVVERVKPLRVVFDSLSEIRLQAISTVKRRGGSHEHSIRELRIDPDGIRVGRQLGEFHGVLSGRLDYTGEAGPLLGADGHSSQP